MMYWPEAAVTDCTNVLGVDNHRKPHYWTLIQLIHSQHALSHFITERQRANSGCNAVLHLFGVHYLGLCTVGMINTDIIKSSAFFRHAVDRK